MGCAFLKSLSTLRKHSAESVDFADVISDQSKYLHVHRTIEDDLIALLEQAKQSTAKSLVFRKRKNNRVETRKLPDFSYLL